MYAMSCFQQTRYSTIGNGNKVKKYYLKSFSISMDAFLLPVRCYPRVSDVRVILHLVHNVVYGVYPQSRVLKPGPGQVCTSARRKKEGAIVRCCVLRTLLIVRLVQMNGIFVRTIWYSISFGFYLPK